jgi:transposase
LLPEVRHVAHQADISLLPLPTYSSWRNPIEKLWRWLKQTVIHMHPWANQWERLQAEIENFLSQFQKGSSRLLRYVGLSD